MTGILYSIGVGPGDPELLTRKAERLIRSCPVLAAPGGRDSTSFRIAVQGDSRDCGEACLSLHLPMTRDQQVLKESHRVAAEQVAETLKSGQDVALLTLGDPSIYSTCIYIQNQIQAMGFSYQMVAGVPSFCAAAAALGESLTEADKPLRILPASYPCTEPELDARASSSDEKWQAVCKREAAFNGKGPLRTHQRRAELRDTGGSALSYAFPDGRHRRILFHIDRKRPVKQEGDKSI